MSFPESTFTLIEFVVGSTATVVAVVTWEYRDRPAGTPLFAMAITAMLYAALSVLASFLVSPLVWELVRGLQYPLTAAIAVESFYVAVEFSQRREYRRPEIRTLLFGFVLASLSTAMTDPVHDLLTSSPTQTATGTFTVTYGPLFWVHTLVALTIISASIAILAIEAVNAEGVYREQTVTIIVGFLIGIAFFLWEAIEPIHPAFDISVVGIVGWCFATLWAVSRVDLLETGPIARETLIDSMDDSVLALDTTDRIVDTNPHVREQFDISENAVGNPVAEVLGEYPPLLEAIDSDRDECEIALEKCGDTRHFHVRTSPVYDSHFQLLWLDSGERRIGKTIVVRDITDRKRQRQEIERQNERLDEFVSVVSHDLRNPLSVAEGCVELAREECDSDQLDAAARAHDRMEELIDDLLTLARSGKSIDELEPVELSTVVERSRRSVEMSKATLIVDTDRTVRADPARLQQLLENLLRNSVEHGGEGVTVTIGNIQDGFYVEDDGPGIPLDERSRVFEGGYSTAERGGGFGLRIVEQIVEGHGWMITVTEGADGGARFEITGVESVETEP